VLCEALPRLQRRESKLSQHARRVASECDKLAGCEVRWATAGGGQPVDESVVAHRPLSRSFRRSHQPRVPVELTGGCDESLPSVLFVAVAHGPSLDGWFPPAWDR